MVGFADAQTVPELIKIWETCFGDSRAYIQMFLTHNFHRIKTVIRTQDGQPVSVAYLLPLTYEKKGQEPVISWYLYAAATLPAYRGRGYFAEILAFIRQNIKEPVILVPAEASLVGYYEKQGFHRWLEQVSYERTADNKKDFGEAFFQSLTAEEYVKVRDKQFLADGYMKWSEPFMAYIFEENTFCGGAQVTVQMENETQSFLYRKDGEVLYIPEAIPQKLSEKTLQKLLQHTACTRAVICQQPTVMATADFTAPAGTGYFNLTMG